MTDRSGGPDGAADAEPRVEVGLATDVGRVRTGNEDSIICEPLESLLVSERGLFCAVADGMGGHAAGEEASSLAVQVARDSFYGGSTGFDTLETLRQAVAQANYAVYEAGAGKTGRDHMGTTLTAAVLFNHRVMVGHVGDSRCYLVRHHRISQISKDHSWVAEEVAAGRMTPEQARVNPRRNIITRALGLRPDVEVDTYQTEIEPGNILVICSDGLHGLVGEEEIVSYVRRMPPSEAVHALVQLANERGGPDNISVVVARVMGDERDEADTERGFPILTEESMATARVDLSDYQTGPSHIELPSEGSTMEPITTPAAALPPSAMAPEPIEAPGPDIPVEVHHDPPTPRSPITTPMVAGPIEEPQRRDSGAGVKALVWLALSVIVAIIIVALGFWALSRAGYI